MNDKSIQTQLVNIVKQVFRFKVLLFLLLVIILYGYIGLRISELKNAQPAQSALASQTTTLNSPPIDQATINKINQLQDNSVSVQALFNQARQNPFQE